MNTLLLLAGFCPRSRSAWSLLTRIFGAVAVLSIEMQIVTWTGLGSLRTLPLVNAPLAIAWLLFERRMSTTVDPAERRFRARDALPLTAVLAVEVLVAVLNLLLPVEAADPYHMDKLTRIEQTGTLAYDPAGETKINVLSSVYELVLADLRQIPTVGSLFVQFHGFAGLLLYVVAIAVVQQFLNARPDWLWAMLLTVPVVFHQLVLIKNDLFVGAPAVAVLTWSMTRPGMAAPHEIVWAVGIAAMTAAIKLTNLPLLVLSVGALLVERPRDRSAVGAAAVGVIGGLAAGGLVFMVSENLRLYGEWFPFAGIGGPNRTAAAALMGVPRFALSLFDLGLLTREVWPGRGGWGGTFGVPLIWALAVHLAAARRAALPRRTLLFCSLYFVMFAVGFEDADLAHRLALAPGIVLIAVAIDHVVRHPELRMLRMAAGPVIALSAAQILRSAWLYLTTR